MISNQIYGNWSRRRFWSRLASQAAWYRMENGPKSKNGKKLAQKMKRPSARNGEKMAQKSRKNRKMTPNPTFPILGHFPPFRAEGRFIFCANFFPFLDFGPFSILSQAAWLASHADLGQV